MEDSHVYDVDLLEILRRPTKVLRMLCHLNHCQFGLKGQRWDKMKEDYQASGILQAGNEPIKVFICKHVLSFKKREE